jgi:NADH:ubiquinone oxidoreductase subunit 5 (subunit L)/multisubunit Na+/H+ antiporter MnhA subunit
MLETMYYLLFFLEMFFFFLICFFMFVDESSTKSSYMKNEHLGNYRMGIPLIGVNFFLIVLSAYGGYQIDYYVMNTTSPVSYALLSSPISDYTIWSVIFIAVFLIHILLLFTCVFYYMREATFDEKAYMKQNREL